MVTGQQHLSAPCPSVWQRRGGGLSRFGLQGLARACGLVVVCWVVLGPLHALAHDVGFSTAEVRCGTNGVGVEMVLAVKDAERLFELDADGDGRVTPEEFTANQELIGRYLRKACRLQGNGEAMQPEGVGSSMDGTDNVKLSVSFPAHGLKEASVRFELLWDLPPGHRMLVSVVDGAENRVAEQLLGQSSPEMRFSLRQLSGGSATQGLPSFFGFIKLGIEHIGTGYDHLLFLFALLLVVRGFRSALAVITCFTLAHSVTLAAATFNLVSLSSRITEPLIAVTIVYVGLENILRRGDPHGRWALTFGFGLVHGFGFASVLREMGVGAQGGGVALPLLGFNLGVELGQVAVAAVALPLIWRLRTQPLFLSRGVPACSGLVVLLGSYWLLQRLWG